MNMRRLLGYVAVALMLLSCGNEGGRFRLEGRLRNMNYGEFWVYSPDEGFDGIDTIKVRNSRFAYEWDLRQPATLVVIFPNYSEQPVFAEPGATVNIKGDATHLKELTISGTDDNKEMTKLRMNLNKLMPPEIPGAVETFIREHPASVVGRYLVSRYFILSADADYRKAAKLVGLMLNEDPKNVHLLRMKEKLSKVQGGSMKSKCPAFNTVDVKGTKVTEKVLNGEVNVVTAWASWSYRSNDQQRRLRLLKKKHGDKLAALSICLDGRPADCKERILRDSIRWPNVCDGQLWNTPLLAKFGLADVPDNVVMDGKGRVVARSLEPKELEEKIEAMLKD